MAAIDPHSLTSIPSTITINDITSVTSPKGDVANATGSYDRIMTAIRAQLNSAVENNEITQGEAGEATAAHVMTAMGQAIQYELSRELTSQKLITETLIQNKIIEETKLVTAQELLTDRKVL